MIMLTELVAFALTGCVLIGLGVRLAAEQR